GARGGEELEEEVVERPLASVNPPDLLVEHQGDDDPALELDQLDLRRERARGPGRLSGSGRDRAEPQGAQILVERTPPARVVDQTRAAQQPRGEEFREALAEPAG